MNASQSELIPFKQLLREKELWLLMLVIVLYFYRPLFMGETMYFRDLTMYFFFPKKLLVDFFQARTWPLWNPYQQGGQTYFGDISNAPFYPTNFLYLALPLIRAYNLNIVLHFLFSAAATYGLARTLACAPWSSFIAGAIYACCGYTLSLSNLIGLLMAMPYLPLLILCWHRFLTTLRSRWFVSAVLVGGLQVLAGAPETNILTMCLLFGWMLCYPYQQISLTRKALLWLLLGICIVGVAAIQIIPTAEMILQSTRGQQGFQYADLTTWPLLPKQLPDMIFPRFLGDINTAQTEERYWGIALVGKQGAYILSVYFGVAALSLACWGGLAGTLDTHLPRRTRRYLLGVMLAALFFALGPVFPFFQIVYQVIPVLKFFRYPIKFLIAAILPVALLAGYAADVHFGARAHRLNRGTSAVSSAIPVSFVRWLWLVFALLSAWGLAFALFPPIARSVQMFFFGRADNPVMLQGLAQSFLHASVMAFLAALLFQYRRLLERPWQHGLLALICVMDLLAAGKHVNFYVRDEFFTLEPPIVASVKAAIGAGRLYRTNKEDSINFRLRTPTDDGFWVSRWHLETLNYHLAGLYGIPALFNRDITYLSQARMILGQQILEQLPWPNRLPFLSAGAVTLIITSDALDVPGIQRVQEIPLQTTLPLYLYRNERAARRAEFVTAWTVADSDPQAINMLIKPTFEPRQSVILQQAAAPFWHMRRPPDLAAALRQFTLRTACPPAAIQTETTALTRTRLAVTNVCAGWLVLAEPYYPGWYVRVDGVETPIFRANYAFSAVLLQPGAHRIERYYRPDAVFAGVLGSFIAIALIGLGVWRRHP